MSSNILIDLENNIALSEADVIVNAANTHLLQGSGVCGAIFEQAGAADLQRACDMIGHCKVGSAVMTPAYNLKAKYIAHAVGPKWFGGEANEPEQLYGAYKKSLELAREYKCHSIVFPLLSTGVYKYPVDKAWIKAIEACKDFITENPDWDIEIRFSVRDQSIYDKGLIELEKQMKAAPVSPDIEEGIPAIPVSQGPGFPQLEEAINIWYANEKKESPFEIINMLLLGLTQNIQLFVPVLIEAADIQNLDPNKNYTVKVRNLTNPDGTYWIPLFTSEEELKKGEQTQAIPELLANIMVSTLENEKCMGIVINPWGNVYTVPVEVCEKMLQQTAPTQDEIDLNKGADAYSSGDYKTAYECYCRSAAAGNTIAMSNLGYCFYYGRYVDVNKTMAKKYWEKAAILGQDIAAMYKLGDMYRNGDLEQDIEYSNQLYLRSFSLSQANPDMHTFPDICIRILRYCSEGLSRELCSNLANVAVQALEQRIAGGDTLSGELLSEAHSFAAKYNG